MNKINIQQASAQAIPSIIKDMYTSHLEYKKVEQVEVSRRRDSDNRTKVFLEEIKAKKEIVLQALENDREINHAKIKESFLVIDKALDSGNLKMLELGLGSMLRVAENSSINGLSSLVKQLEDDNSIIDI